MFIWPLELIMDSRLVEKILSFLKKISHKRVTTKYLDWFDDPFWIYGVLKFSSAEIIKILKNG